MPAVVPLFQSKTKILIIGGYNSKTYFNDVFVYNIVDQTYEKVKDQDEAKIVFRAPGNECHLTSHVDASRGEVCALVSGGSRTFLVQYKESDPNNIVTIMKEDDVDAMKANS